MSCKDLKELCSLIRHILVLLCLACILFSFGCATKNEVIRVERDQRMIKRELRALIDEVTRFSKQTQKTMEEIDKSLRPLKKGLADTDAVIDNLRFEFQSLRGKAEEIEYSIDEKSKEGTSLKAGYVSELKDVHTKLSQLEARLFIVEGFIASKNISSQKSEQKDTTDAKKPKSMEQMYYEAYDDFKKGNIEKARIGFREFLQKFPKSEYSDNAQYWIGESFFIEKKYREAILEYEEVISRYSKGNKVPSALLKQGLAFYRLKDNTSAKLLLQKVTKEYPESSEAEIAKKELKKLKN
ncbi:MAG: tol-pal system protein YbgF [Thermodesulfobacteriota bacterium]|nr:tol-pal system protein YbgF [Thermodesulfobacteriota bacterium]